MILNQQRETGGNASDKAPKKALALYSVGVEKGDPYAYYALGRQLMRYGDSNQLQIHGYDLMMRALEVGHTFAMNELGYFYLDEHSKYHDPKRGLRYLRESAARDDIYGFNNMGLVYRNGLGGVKPDPKQALAWFTKAANGGHPVAPTNLGLMYAKGAFGVQSKDALAVLLGRYDRKANMDDPVDRAVELAHVFWFKSPFRVDLY